MTIRLKRIYEGPQRTDGFRVLVDRLWPRGVSRDGAHLDLWLRDAAPSDALRKWYAHDPDRWGGFRRRYLHELKERRGVIQPLLDRARRGTVTLLFAAKDGEHCNARVLEQYLNMCLRAQPAGG